ncbi:MAG: glycosyltransferase family 4 protein [Thermomicrobiales bacterium]
MRVAIDGSFLHLPPSGTGTYLRHLLEALTELDPTIDLRLLEPNWFESSPRGRGLPGPIARALAIRGDARVRRATWDTVGVARAARRSAPDLLHVPHFAAPLRSPAPLIVTIHDVIPLIWPEYRASRAMRVNLAVMRRTVRRARLILTPSEASARDVERMLGIPRRRIRVTPEAAGLEYAPAKDHRAASEVARCLGVTGRYVFNVGGLDVRKNLPVLLDAFARALPRLKEPTRLVIAGAAHSGNPSVFPPLEPVIARLGLSGQVILPGRLANADKIALYQAARLYVTPSLYEGFGLTALEAMACGVPTIAANRTSLPEVVGDGGLLVEPEPEALAAAMVRVLNSPDEAEGLRARGMARAATFSWRRTAELTHEAYEEASSERKGEC